MDNPHDADGTSSESEKEPSDLDIQVQLEALRQERDALKDRLSAVNQESAARRIALKQKQEEIESLQQATLADQGNWQELAEQHAARLAEIEPLAQRFEGLMTTIAETNTTRIEQIPDGKKSLVPSGLTPEALRDWLDANWSHLQAPKAPDLDGGAGSGQLPKKTVKLTDQERALIDATGMTVQHYLDQKARRGQPIQLTDHAAQSDS
jgi:hypothetical protein